MEHDFPYITRWNGLRKILKRFDLDHSQMNKRCSGGILRMRFIRGRKDFWAALIGFAFFTRSSSNLVIVLEFVILMIPHICIENIPIKKSNDKNPEEEV